MIRVLTLLVALGGSAAAAQDHWPALYDVSGVGADDVLNVRAAPSTGAEIVGTLQADAKDIEVVAADSEKGWGMVNIGEGAGWVSLAYLAPSSNAGAGGFPVIRSCHGTEPFWSLTLDEEGGVTFSTPEADSQTGAIQSRWTSLNRPDRHGFSARLGTTGYVALVGQSACGDGMSDRSYGLTIDLLLGGNGTNRRHLSGCCSLLP